MADFVEAAQLDQLAPGQGMTVTVGGKNVALFNVDGTVYAMEYACLHAGASLGMGILEGKVRPVPRARLALQRHHRQHDACAGLRGHELPGTGGRWQDSGGRHVNRGTTAAARGRQIQCTSS